MRQRGTLGPGPWSPWGRGSPQLRDHYQYPSFVCQPAQGHACRRGSPRSLPDTSKRGSSAFCMSHLGGRVVTSRSPLGSPFPGRGDRGTERPSDLAEVCNPLRGGPLSSVPPSHRLGEGVASAGPRGPCSRMDIGARDAFLLPLRLHPVQKLRGRPAWGGEPGCCR